jgi:radical SAM superfamily enzyme YgiQ (UPF0313 family)
MRLDSIGMADDWPQAEVWLGEHLHRYQPNLVLIGAMSISFRGALEAARIIRASAYSKALVVLGGKHVTETMWIKDDQPCIQNGAPIHRDEAHSFDLFVSGDGEDVVAELGESLAEAMAIKKLGPERAALTMELAEKRLLDARGDWAIFWRDHGTLKWLRGRGLNLRPDDYPLVYDAYPIDAHFPVLERPFTAHAYSYTGRGCLFRCFFCSESADINGPIRGLENAGRRLATQMSRLETIALASGTSPLSVFVEDSILLQGAPGALRQFSEEMCRLTPDVKFGGQFTIDMLLDPVRQEYICKLARQGLSYVFIGLETMEDTIAAAMSKNHPRGRQNKLTSWLSRFERAMQFLITNNIKVGISLLFGLGEGQNSRLAVLQQLKAWQNSLGEPRIVSLNWAVKHPMRELLHPTLTDYTQWPVDPADPRLSIIQRLFSEASTHFCMAGVDMASFSDLRQIEAVFLQLQNDL